VRRSASFLGGAETVLAEQTAERLPAERNTFDLAKLFTEMMIVKTNVAGGPDAGYGPAYAQEGGAG